MLLLHVLDVVQDVACSMDALFDVVEALAVGACIQSFLLDDGTNSA